MPTVFSSSSASTPRERLRSVASERHTIMTPFTSFAVSPSGIRFETQEDEEVVKLFLRQHVITLVMPFLLVVVLAIAPMVLLPFFGRFLPLPFTLPTGYIIVGTAFWYVVTFGVALMSFLRWFFNIYIVTDQRVVDIDFIHLLYKEFSEARIDRIQDIGFRSGGILAAFFDYGDVTIETAGEVPNLEFSAVPMPGKVVETISQLIEQRSRR